MGNVFYGVQSGLNSVVYTIGQYYDHPADLKDMAFFSKNLDPGRNWDFAKSQCQWCTQFLRSTLLCITLKLWSKSLN